MALDLDLDLDLDLCYDQLLPVAGFWLKVIPQGASYAINFTLTRLPLFPYDAGSGIYTPDPDRPLLWLLVIVPID